MSALQNPGKVTRAIIADRWPDIAAKLASAASSPELSLFDQGHYPSIVADNIRLASAWDPYAEAQLQLQNIADDACNATIFGIGMGYLPLTVLESHPTLQQVQVVPLNLALFNRMIDYIDMTVWLQSPKVELQLPHSVETIPQYFAVTAPILQLTEKAAERLRDRIRQRLAETHAETFQRSRDKLVARNIKKNLAHSDRDKDVSTLFGLCNSTQTAVVIGAGPSLDQCMDRIRGLQQQGATLIAVDAAVQALHHCRLVPDFVVAIDPLEYIREFLRVSKTTHRTCGLVYFPSANPKAVANWPGKRFYAAGTHEKFKQFRQKKSASILFSSGGVIHPATDLAVRSGAGHIVMAGADFGYPFDNTHAKGVSVSKQASVVSNTGYSVRDYRGKEIPSSMNFISYYRDLEQYINTVAPKHIRFSNLGLDSAAMAGVTPIELDIAGVC